MTNIWQFHQNGRGTSRMGGATSFPYPALPSRFKTLLYASGSGLHVVLWSHIGILLRLLAAEPRSSAGLLFLSQYLSGMIWLTPYLMVWDWPVSRPGSMPFCWPSCSFLFCLQLFSLSLLFLYRLVVWGWGIRTDRVSISLSRPCIANLF